MRATQTVQRPHVRRCGGGGRAQLTHRSDGSAIAAEQRDLHEQSRVREITSFSLALVVLLAAMA